MASDNNGKKNLDIKMIATVIGMTVMLSGLVGQWFTHKAAVAELQQDVVKIEQIFSEYRKTTDERIMSMKLDITSSSSDIRTIKENVGEIKADIKTLLMRPR